MKKQSALYALGLLVLVIIVVLLMVMLSRNPNTKTPDSNNNIEIGALAEVFPVQRNVFGIKLLAATGVSIQKIDHAEKILRNFVDANGDGAADDSVVLEEMARYNASLYIFANQSDYESSQLETKYASVIQVMLMQGLNADEMFNINGEGGKFDTTIEQVIKLLYRAGYSKAYPKIFGNNGSSQLAKAMDVARGGYFEKIPGSYAASAWFTNSDKNCSYGCQVAEYFYWSLSSLRGDQKFDGRAAQIAEVWDLNTLDLVQSKDKAVYNLLVKKEYKLPTLMPN